jgi:hypothetical protein
MVAWMGRSVTLLALAALVLADRPPGRFPWWRFLSLVALVAFFWTPWRVPAGAAAVGSGAIGLLGRLRVPAPNRQDLVEILELVAWAAFIWAVRPL